MLQSEKRFLREEQILATLNELGYATRKQLQIICCLSGDRNAARILKRMEDDKTIQSLRRECKVYYLTNRGKEAIGSNSDVRTGAMDHTLMRNDLYIKLGMPDDWKPEFEVLYDAGNKRMVVDAMYSKEMKWHFVEVDNKLTMKTNESKIKAYAILKGDIRKDYGHEPTLIWYTVSKARKERLEGWMQDYGVKGKVYV